VLAALAPPLAAGHWPLAGFYQPSIYSRTIKPEARSQQPEASNQQPATSNQQPATRDQQPATRG